LARYAGNEEMEVLVKSNRTVMRIVVLMFIAAWAVPACAQQPSVKVARLIRAVKDGRPNKFGNMTPPSGSVLLMAYFEVTKADALPVVLDLYNVAAIDAAGQKYPVLGILPANIESETLTIAFRPVSMGGSGMSEVTESAHSGGDDSDFELKNYGPEAERSARMTLKKLPGGFSLFFVVPEKAGAYQIQGVAGKALSTGNLALPAAAK
jgi:hypothetical protein